ncbi:hypothetical protein Pse7367_3756 (plasmid) [Thalassoporum mexicanum PCC 7367]|uniref:hypothetical protein n=1 Tax=Thalassoporum mexicanum TaxID=3457544 RepID=UPI00029F875B|nr:hypothetical protein [Pseudanabaena sp. PCC 7367]AFY71982.1 hypothetical protein Pse7367_3756 [Pseudanabaena sp. PCC 7367]
MTNDRKQTELEVSRCAAGEIYWRIDTWGRLSDLSNMLAVAQSLIEQEAERMQQNRINYVLSPPRAADISE